MAEPTKQQIGDGNDNVGGAVNQGIKAAKQFGRRAATKALNNTAQTTVNAANLVKAGAKGGKAIAEIASGTAAGGPWGAIIAAAWSMRHTLFKILVCVCLVVLFIIVTVVAIPGILLDNIVNVFVPDAEEPEYSVVQESYEDDFYIEDIVIREGTGYGGFTPEQLAAGFEAPLKQYPALNMWYGSIGYTGTVYPVRFAMSYIIINSYGDVHLIVGG